MFRCRPMGRLKSSTGFQRPATLLSFEPTRTPSWSCPIVRNSSTPARDGIQPRSGLSSGCPLPDRRDGLPQYPLVDGASTAGSLPVGNNHGHPRPDFMQEAANVVPSTPWRVSVVETVVGLESAREKRQKA